MMITQEAETRTEAYPALQPPHRLLFGPGPSMVHPRVYEALTKPVVGHLDPFFFRVMDDVQEMLKTVFGTKTAFTLAISGTGSAGMEAAVANFIEPGTKFAIFANGYFCDRISEMGKRHGAQVVRFEKPWGETFGDEEARSFILAEKPELIAFVHAETSAGTLQSGKVICEAAHDIGALVIADTVTSLGAMPVNFDEVGIDIAYSCSQKALGCPPGLAPMALSQRAVERLRMRTSPPRTWYLDLKMLFDYFTQSHRYHHTAPISMFYALREALRMIHEEGIEARWDRHFRAHLAFVNGIQDLGLQMHVQPGHRIWNLNTVRVPKDVDDAKVRKTLMDEYGIEIQGGFGPLAGKVFRIGIMGPLAAESHVKTLLQAMEHALAKEGFSAPMRSVA